MLSSIRRCIRNVLLVPIIVISWFTSEITPAATPQASNALTYLRQKMDQYLNFGVYADNFSASNHFEPTGWMGDAITTGVVTVDPACTDTWHSGGNSIRITYTGSGAAGWAGIYWLHPAKNWGTDPNGGFNLAGATKLTFWVRGAKGGEKAEFKMGGIHPSTGPDYGDTVETISTGVVKLTKSWQQFTINLTGKNLSRVVGGFVWVTKSSDNPDGATIYLDDIRYEGFANKLRLIESYTNLTDFVPPRPMYTHKYLYVYLDNNSAANSFFNNGFYESGWMGDRDAISVNMNETGIKHGGASAMRWSYSGVATQGQNWAGVYWQAPAYFWGDRIGGYNLSGAARLTFWVRGASGGETVHFLVGGITGPYNDSLMPERSTTVTLTTNWTKYAIDLAGADLTRIGGGFGWTIEHSLNPQGATFYLDDVRYENGANPAGDTYQITNDTFPVDSYSMMTAYTYDNALALLAFLSTGDVTDAGRAKLLADSLVWAQQHDEFKDGRIRNAYYPDDLGTGTTYGSDGKIARHNYDMYGNGAGPGNMGWTMIALLNYYKKFPAPQYKDAATSIGQWIENHCHATPPGYTAGYNGWPPSGITNLSYKSTEHNIDIYVAFMKLYEVTGDHRWMRRAMDAKSFVSSMWNKPGAYFFTGTKGDGVTPNTDNLPLDVMPWGFLAMGEIDNYGRGLASALANHYTSETIGLHVFEGVGFNANPEGVWLEGTAHLVSAFWPLYYFGTGATRSFAYNNAVKYQGDLREAQLSAPRTDGKGMVATLHDKVYTGFDLPTGGKWYYYNRLHIGASAWFIISEQQWNPYWGIPANQTIPYQYENGASGVKTDRWITLY